MTFSWHTVSSAAVASLTYGLSAAALGTTATGDTTSYLAGSYNHHVTVKGLTPSTRYYYQCGVAGAGTVSEVFTFVSAPAAGGGGAFSFSVFGDWGYGEDGKAVDTRGQLEEITTATDEGVDFVWHVGDISYADDAFLHDTTAFSYENVYSGFMAWISNITQRLPYMVSPGNHESECHSPACITDGTYRKATSNYSAYNKRWRMPFAASKGTSNMWYSWDYGLAHFISIDTETDFGCSWCKKGDSGLLAAGGFGRDGEYIAWLEADLAHYNATLRAKQPWLFVGGHRPVYTATGKDTELAASVEELFHKYKVDVYFCGHLHHYSRSLPVYNSTVTPGETVHVMGGGAGNDEGEDKVDSKRAAWNAHVDDTEWGTGVMHVLNRTHAKYEYISSSTGKVQDSFVLSK